MGVKCVRGAVLFAQEFSTLCLQRKDCSACRKAEEHCETHLVHLPAPEGCSWRTGEFCNILPIHWKSGSLSDPCRISVGFLGKRFCNVFILDCCLNSLQQLVFSQRFYLAVLVIPLSGLSWLCPEHLHGLGVLLRSSLHLFSHLSNFLEEFRHLIIRAFKVSHTLQMLKLLLSLSHFYHFGILEQCFLKTWSITILRAGRQ